MDSKNQRMPSMMCNTPLDAVISASTMVRFFLKPSLSEAVMEPSSCFLITMKPPSWLLTVIIFPVWFSRRSVVNAPCPTILCLDKISKVLSLSFWMILVRFSNSPNPLSFGAKNVKFSFWSRSKGIKLAFAIAMERFFRFGCSWMISTISLSENSGV